MCVGSIENSILASYMTPFSTPEGDVEKKKLADLVQSQYTSIRRESVDQINKNLADTSRPIRIAFDEWRGAYALINALSYL